VQNVIYNPSSLPIHSTHKLNSPDPSCVLLPPRQNKPLPTGLLNQIIASLATRFNTTVAAVRRNLHADQIVQWGKVRRTDGGDTMKASSLVMPQEDKRDATFVRVSIFHCFVTTILTFTKYEVLVDKHARSRNRRPEYQTETFFGQLQHIFVVPVPLSNDLGLTEPTTALLAAIRACEITGRNDLDMHYYKELGRLDVVDMTCVQCLVGRVIDGKFWAVFDRSGSLARAIYVEEPEEVAE
jgi:hypothetical protein